MFLPPFGDNLSGQVRIIFSDNPFQPDSDTDLAYLVPVERMRIPSNTIIWVKMSNFERFNAALIPLDVPGASDVERVIDDRDPVLLLV